MKRVRWAIAPVMVTATAAAIVLCRGCAPSGSPPPIGSRQKAASSSTPPWVASPPDEWPTIGRPAPVRARAALFLDPAALDAFHLGMNRVTGSISAEKARERFSALGVDTEANKDRALILVKTAYSAAREREEVRKKVLAQYFLAYSTKLGDEECMSALSANADFARASAGNGGLHHVYALDVLALAKTCARKNFAEVARLAQEDEDPLVRAQMNSALQFVEEERSESLDD